MMEEHFALMFALVAGAAVIPFVARRLSIPSAVLEIIYGLLLFHTLIPRKPDWFLLLKEIGFLYLMFIVGMELDIRMLVRGGRFLWYVLTPLLPLVLMPVIMVYLGYPFFTGIAVSVLSAGIIIPVLKEEEMLHSGLGRDIIGIALTGELLSILVLTGIDIYSQHGLTIMALLQGLKLLLLTGLAALFLKVLYVLAWWNPERVEKVMESEDPVEEGLRAVIAVAFAGALMAYGAGVEPIFGSFMAGLVFSAVFKSKGMFEQKINAVGFGFFTPFFFIGVGADLDMRVLSSLSTVSDSLFLTLMVFVSNLVLFLFARVLNLGGRESLSVTLLLSAPLSLMVVSGTLGEKMGFLSNTMSGSLILAAVISGILFPFLFRLVNKRALPEQL
jgi:Kef-type K+ transport system membrane component KefB